MGIVTVLAAAIAVGAIVAATVLASRERSARRDLVVARTENEKLTVRLAQEEADHRTADELRQELADLRLSLTNERDDALTALTDEQKQRADLEVALTEARTRRTELDGELLEEHRRRTELEGEVDRLRKELENTAPPSERESDGCWALLLADVERRWAAVVGAPPDLRGVHLGAVDHQLEEALGRETDRLREEVGVDISLTADAALEPDDPVLFLLAATDLLGVLATNCQRVTIEADGALTLTGEEWTGPTTDLEAARDRVQAAGAALDDLVIDQTSSDEDLDGDGDGDGEDGPRLTRPTNYRVRVAVHPGRQGVGDTQSEDPAEAVEATTEAVD